MFIFLLCVIKGKKALFLPAFLIIVMWGTVCVSAQANTAEAVLTRVSALLSELKFDEAIALFDTIAQPERDSSHVKLLKASVLSSAGKYAEARTIAEGVTKAEPRNIDAFTILAAIEGASGRQRQQQTALEQVIRIDPENIEALITLGEISIRNRSARNAASYFNRVLRKDDKNPYALIGLSRAFRMNNEWDGAEQLLNRAVELYPRMSEARVERARLYRSRSFYVQALADLDEAKKLDPSDYWISTDRGTLLLDMNRRSQALEEFNRAISINPGEFLAYIYTSGLKDDLGDYEGAGRDYEILARLRPDYYYALEGLGLHKMKDEKWAEARDAFMEAYKRAPQETHFALLAAINWMRTESLAAPRQFLSQAHAKVKRDTLEWYMFRLYYDLTVRNYVGENDMLLRLDQEKDLDIKARMMFYMAQYYDIRGNTATANKYYLLVNEMDRRAIPEWRLNDWILRDRDLKPF